ncbi:MAG TPA: hypothetical protein QGF58_07875 [Myxococcota bacterium]|nr:hypothetical protein [Myxococcota bacterium]
MNSLTLRSDFVFGGHQEGDTWHYVIVSKPSVPDRDEYCCSDYWDTTAGFDGRTHVYLRSDAPGDVTLIEEWVKDGTAERPDWMDYMTCPRWE